MSVNTTASDSLEKAKEHIQAATEALAAIVVHDCYGTEDYTEETRDQFKAMFITLLDLKSKF